MAVLSGVMAILFFCVSSCKLRSSQLTFHHIGSEGWASTDTCVFQVDSLLDPGTYILSVAFRTSSACRYPYRQLVLEVTQHVIPSETFNFNTVSCLLAQRDGEVEGRGTSIYAYDFPVDTLLIRKGESRTVSVRHLMRKTPLLGVYDVGILLTKL